MRLVVISDETQNRLLKSSAHANAPTRFLCDNHRYSLALEKRGVAHDLLDDLFLDRKDWSAASAWGHEAIARWIRLCDAESVFGGVHFVSALYLRLSYLLLELVRAQLLADKIFSDFTPSAVTVFRRGYRSRRFQVSGNILLNEALARGAAQRGVAVETLEVPEVWTAPEGAEPPRGWRSAASQTFASSADRLTGVDLLVHGALRKHLGPLVRQMKSAGLSIGFFDTEFRAAHWLFSLRAGIRYGVLPRAKPSQPFIREASDELERALRLAEEHALFVRGGDDFGPLLKRIVQDSWPGIIREYAALASALGACLASGPRVKAFLTDEDTTFKGGFLARYFQARGVRVYCVSHALSPVNFAVRDDLRIFSNATTFVHCELERAMYANRGWDPARIHITGIPRFDRLHRTAHGLRRSGRPLRLLYCGASMRFHEPSRAQGYFGLHIMNLARMQKPTVERLLEATRDYRVEVKLRPHNYIDATWAELAKASTPTRPVRVISPKTDFVRELKRCDVLVLAHWSTAVIEAMAIGLPIILLDFFHIGELAPYAGAGTFYYVRTVDELRGALDRLMASGPVPSKRSETAEQTIGKNDGRGAQRIADFVKAAL